MNYMFPDKQIGTPSKTQRQSSIELYRIIVSCLSIYGINCLYNNGYINSHAPYFFISDSNKFLSVSIGLSSFMWFKSVKNLNN